MAEFSSPITREEDFRAIWKYLALQIEHTLKVTVDATPDPARACFFSYDPDLLTNPRCRPLDPKKTLREAEAITELMRITRPARTGAADVLVCHENGAADVPNNGAADVLVCHENGAADVLVCQSPEGACEGKDKLLRSFANGDVCGSPLTPPPIREIRVIRGQSTPDDLARATEIVQKLAQMVIPYSDWYRVGLALYAGFGEAGRPLWNMFLNNPNYQDRQWELDAKWRSFRGVREITLATLFEIGGRHGIN